MTKTSNEANSEVSEESELQRVLCIYYPAQFGEFFIKGLIDSSSKVNVMQPSFPRKLGLRIYKTNIGAYTIDGSRLETFGIVITLF